MRTVALICMDYLWWPLPFLLLAANAATKEVKLAKLEFGSGKRG